MKFNKTLLALTITAFMLAGCSSDDNESLATDTSGTDASTTSTTPLSDGGMSSTPIGSGLGTGLGSGYGSGTTPSNASNLGPEFSDPSNPLSKQIIYFELDSSQIRQDFVPVVAAHAQYLTSHPNAHVILAGHTDERGSSEYNISLGEQRGKSVERLLKSQGVSASQLEVVSYGEEKPAVAGHNESAWQMNRRVEVGYQ